MSALAKIKKQAAQLEHDRQYDKALALYTRLLDESPDPDDDIDVALYNRAGDVALRAGDLPRAVTYYERALDLYAAGGFLNNAIALGAKILRQAPERAATHYTLGVLHAKKGFRSDARQHFLTYAERMQRAAQAAEVARSLSDYVVLCDGAADARSGLAAHLATGAARPAELSGKLQELLEQALRAAGQLDAADEGGRPSSRGVAAGDLVFLDLDAAAMEAADEGDGASPALELMIPASFGIEPLDLMTEGDDAEAPLTALPGELPPLTPSMVALEVGDDVRSEAEDDWSAPGPAELLVDDTLLLGVPAFADDAPTEAPTEATTYPQAQDDAEPDAVGPALEFLPADEPPAFEVVDDTPPAPRAVEALDLDLELAVVPAAVPAVVPADAPEPPVLELLPEDLVARGPRPAPAEASEGLDLGAWLRDSEPAPSTRLVAPTLPTTGDEQADFQATLDAFKAGIARSLADADFDAHYDLGVAYKEMGLLEEAIGEFQKAARAPGRPWRALEALGSCFLERGEPELVLSTLSPVTVALAGQAPGTAEAPQHVALCYLLGAASQEVGRAEDARGWYLRVLATDYGFRDAAARLASLSPPAR